MDSMPSIGPNEFRCVGCGGVFRKGWSDEESTAEFDRLHGVAGYRIEDADLVCGDCFQKLICPLCNLPARDGHVAECHGAA